MKWACGVCTVPERTTSTLGNTLRSLDRGGFPTPRLFVDGLGSVSGAHARATTGCQQSLRSPCVGAFGNWWMAAWELYIRTPDADRYAMFQDDILCVSNLRQYIEASPYPKDGYLNLITNPKNTLFDETATGWYPAPKKGLGACGLVFDNQTFRTLLACDVTWKPGSPGGDRNIDGTVADMLAEIGIVEYVHAPSLLDHVGGPSVIGNRPQPAIATFAGEDFDVLTLLSKEPNECPGHSPPSPPKT